MVICVYIYINVYGVCNQKNCTPSFDRTTPDLSIPDLLQVTKDHQTGGIIPGLQEVNNDHQTGGIIPFYRK